jgi:hypothetical protein
MEPGSGGELDELKLEDAICDLKMNHKQRLEEAGNFFKNQTFKPCLNHQNLSNL